jgi:hypothetical protein
MIIANLNIVPNRLWYLKIIKYEIKKSVDTYSQLLKGILSIFSKDQINEAIDSIYLIGTSIFCPTSGLNGQILRALEYGTNNNKSYHLISYSTRKVLKEVKGYEYVI